MNEQEQRAAMLKAREQAKREYQKKVALMTIIKFLLPFWRKFASC